MIAEMYGVLGGLIYYRLENWHGFMQVVGQPGVGRVTTEELPDDAVCLIRDGKWTGNMINDMRFS